MHAAHARHAATIAWIGPFPYYVAVFNRTGRMRARALDHRLMIPYLAHLPPGKVALWCYLIWYLVTVVAHFDQSPGLWLNSLGISAVVGVALLLSVEAQPATPARRWQTFRLFLMPFCVSSFAALIKGQGYLLVFPARARELCWSIGLCAGFIALVLLLRKAR